METIVLAIVISFALSVGLIGLAFAIHNAIMVGPRFMCDGKPYDTMNSETWYARCGASAPHLPHRLDQPHS